MAKKNKKGSRRKIEKEFDLPEGLELLETNGWGSKIMKWIKNNFSAIILPIIALIILGGGIYLYSQQRGEGLNVSQEDLKSGVTINLEEQTPTGATQESQDLTEEKNEAVTPTEEQTENEEEVAVTENVQEDKTVQQTEPQEEFNSTTVKNIYREEAQAGEGITHLARRALKDYLMDKHLSLSAEHKIYIEDYLQNRTGTRNLNLGEELTFSRGLIEEAISQAQLLTTAQLHNLEQYSRLVPSLNY